ncbi:uncharacterized protein LOC124932115 [Impatiens glandulifera]|uniref:uncharacterized protein LOC124932115 n=1 Tax=Impatiens glandulifera TaxID=253017 RepID=UPI001FB04E86|nr:uncharacterized protein LOC124932115 [Impatiens glandulifera]
MGSCLSSSSAATVRRGGSDLQKQSSNKANVVSPNGQLRQYEVPITVAGVLIDDQKLESMEEVVGVSKSAFFICNSDNLYFNEHIKAMDMDDVLQAGQIYFLLPSSKLRLPLSASEMAALAVKATIALQKTPPSSSDSNRGRRQSKKARISPVVEEAAKVSSYNPYIDGGEDYSVQKTVKNGNYYPIGTLASSSSKSSSLSMRSGSVRKLQRNPSKRARIFMAARSFKIKLSTIYEGSIV